MESPTLLLVDDVKICTASMGGGVMTVDRSALQRDLDSVAGLTKRF
jgi:hypothetical protein